MSDINDYISTNSYAPALNLVEKDELINVELVQEDRKILQVTAQGQCLVYAIDQIPVHGRRAQGVNGIKLNDGDYVVFGGQIEEEGEILVTTSAGHVKRVIACTLDETGRYLKGVKIVEIADSVVSWIGFVKMPYDLAFVLPDESVSVVNTEDIPIDTRTTKGKKLFKGGIDTVISLEQKEN